MAFEANKHSGSLGKEISFLSSNTPQVGIMAFKKMENEDYYLVRVNELFGKDLQKASLSFGGKIIDAYEVNGQEQKLGPVTFKDDQLNFSLTHYTIRSFAVKFAPSSTPEKTVQTPVNLPYNQDVISFDNNRDDGGFSNRLSIAGEMIPEEVVSEGIHFRIGSKEDGADNAISCKGQEISLPEGAYNHVYLLAAATDDTQGDFKINDRIFSLPIQNWTGYIGQFYNREFAVDGFTVTGIKDPYVKQDNIVWFASHYHQSYPSKNVAYQYSCLYKYKIDLPTGARKITLPNNEKIKIMSITVANNSDNILPLQPLFDDFKAQQSMGHKFH